MWVPLYLQFCHKVAVDYSSHLIEKFKQSSNTEINLQDELVS